MEPILEMHEVCRVHGLGATRVEAVTGVSLAVAPGELVAVTGRSGSGKSTLLNLAGGLDRPTAGRVVVAGTDLATLDPGRLAQLRRRQVGYVFQDANLLVTLTAAENVALPLELDGMSVRDARRVAIEALDTVDMAGLADRYPDQLSGGEQQRVGIARALAGPRRLLLADEPAGALDDMSAETILRMIRARCDDGAGALLVTHDSTQAAWADRVIILRNGAVDAVTDRPDATSFLASLVR